MIQQRHRSSTAAVLGVASLVALAGCAGPLPLTGQTQKTGETFKGAASRDSSGVGTLTMVSSTGATCHGDFVFVRRREAKGTLTCDDNRSGSFVIASTDARGTGSGLLGDQRFTFEFGN